MNQLKSLSVAMLITISIAAGCSTNPATGKSEIDPLSTSTEINMGNDYAPKFIEAYGGLIPAKPIRLYVSQIGQSLAAVSERSNLPWKFYILDSQVINAFALPGGKVFITRGLLEKFDNEAQLAGVLGHEIGHITADHISQRYLRAIFVTAGTIAVATTTDSYDARYLSDVVIDLLNNGYSRDEESQSDMLGLRYMTKRGYNPVGQLQVMKVLQQAGSSSNIELLSTHPLPSTRIIRLEQIIYEKYPDFGDTGKYRFNFKNFKQNVLEPLKQLPQPKHDPDNKT